MSDYGNPPQDPNQPHPDGQQQPPPPSAGSPYGQQPGFGAPAYGQQPGYGAPAGPYAHWGKRVGSYLIDGLLTALAAIPLWIGYIMLIAGAETTTENGVTTIENNDVSPVALILILLGFVTYIGFFIWNTCLKQGRTGYSIGKGVLGIKLIKEQTGQPIGAGMAFVRQIAHILDGFCLLGYLWPLWDAKRQTFADKIVGTVVLEQPKG